MITIRQALQNDIKDLAGLEQTVFSDPWSASALTETMQQKHAEIFIAEEDAQTIGWAIFYYVIDEGEIARIAVIPSKRKEGVAGCLFMHLRQYCIQKGIGSVFLEVREGNLPARAFYRKYGFSEDGIRKQYYHDPKEDAILMHLEIS